MATVANESGMAIYLSRLPVCSSMISYLTQRAAQVIPKVSCSGSQANLHVHEADLPSIYEFIKAVVQRSSVPVPTLITSLVYMWRMQTRLPPGAKGLSSTPHRIFLAALILAAKNLNDDSPMNKHWARYSAVPGYEFFGFSITEVNLMERQFLHLLDWDIRIDPQDLHHQLEPLLSFLHIHQPLELAPEPKTDCEGLVRAQQYPNVALIPQTGHVRRENKHNQARD